MSWWKNLLSIGSAVAAPFTGGASLAIPAALEVGGAAAGAGSQAMASNRGAKIDAASQEEILNQNRQRNFFDQVLAREADNRAATSDALRKVQQGDYLAGGGRPYAAPVVGGQTLPTYGFGPQNKSEAVRASGASLGNEAQNRLQNGNPVPPVPQLQQFRFDPKLLKSGFWEKLLGIAGPAASALGGLGADRAMSGGGHSYYSSIE